MAIADEERKTLAELRGFADWAQAGLDSLATQAAEAGRLCGASARAKERMFKQDRSSSAATGPATIPDDFGHLPNWSRTFFAYLKQELHRVLGLPAFDPYTD